MGLSKSLNFLPEMQFLQFHPCQGRVIRTGAGTLMGDPAFHLGVAGFQGAKSGGMHHASASSLEFARAGTPPRALPLRLPCCGRAESCYPQRQGKGKDFVSMTG